MSGLLAVLWVLATGGALAIAAAQWHARSAGLLGVRRACHELRGPITAARLGLQLGARTGELSPASLAALDLELGRAGLALDDLVEPAGLAFTRRCDEDVDVAALLEASVLAWRATAELHRAHLRLHWLGEPATVRGDRLRLAQVAGNLIANAIEHGGGEITVSGTAAAGHVRIEVHDQGPGLPASLKELLGRSGARGAWRGRRRRAEGVHGHGLAIIARIVAQHHGSFHAEPSDHGARLVVELPANREGRPIGHARP